MTHRYEQSTGHWIGPTADSHAFGYSGHGEGLNNPALQGVRAVGPIPRGKWKIQPPRDSDTTGPYTMKLLAADAVPGDDTHQPTGRGAFRIHGDNRAADMSASHGCIILPRKAREAIWASGDHDLEVVA